MTDSSSFTIKYFRAGHVISRTFSAFFANITGLIPLFVVASVPLLLMGLLLPDETMIASDADETAMMEAMGSMVWAMVLIIVFSVAGYCWLSVGVTYAVVSHLRGRRAGGIEILVQSLRAVPRLVLLALVVITAFILMAFINIIPFLGMLIFMIGVSWL
jgi:hypothetical protein